MTDLLWPGDERAGPLMSDAAFLTAMVLVEHVWLRELVEAGVAPAAAAADLLGMVSAEDTEALAAAAERDGNPVSELLGLLRQRSGAETARWVHRGLTSQDIIDTAMMLCARDALAAVKEELACQVRTLAVMVEKYPTPMLARTLTQPAVPSTVAAKLANWLSGLLDGVDTLAALPMLPAQVGGSAGTLAATTELAGSAVSALALSGSAASALGLATALPWHTTRSVVTRIGDVLVTCCDVWAHIANDVAVGSRREIGELAEGRSGGSSTMPQKRNPVLSVLIRRAALTAAPLAATLHAASAASVDERADGGWHAEWATLRTLARRSVVAAAQTSDLLAGLDVNIERACANLAAAGDVLAEQRLMTELTGRAAYPGYTGATDHLIGAVLRRAQHHLEDAT
ncbi:lyase family protein [Mycobacterium intracellulare]|uniref:Lyase family protein n=1 Tax=Mycobacterium intracellulare TaxID=1767 RepID=A0AAE4RF02_MYCIT|nr:lyase family protein [Mycobacterium intracellulare]MDV6979095.1 lyase family protein [Mycobacterium intracellulare]MDV6984503.1 lyase family protein [Mycobacterium intracellulare]MDV7014599.1 lyase family protein [Mycobacterium intracellulare]MDV7029515.1 lyase family protein [Mycobacterium intracellulare]